MRCSAIPTPVPTYLVRWRATITISATIISIGVLTGTVFRGGQGAILEHIGLNLGALRAGRLWTMPAATVIQAQPGITWHQSLLVLASLAAVEYMTGSVQATAIFFLSDWISAPFTVLFLWVLAHVGSETAAGLVQVPDMGSSSAAFASLAAAAVLLPARPRAACLSILFAYLFAAFSYQRLDVAIAHLLASGTGIMLAAMLHRPATDGQYRTEHGCAWSLTSRASGDCRRSPNGAIEELTWSSTTPAS